jgi:hypothetical protein
MANKMRFPLMLRFNDGSASGGADVIEVGCAKQFAYRLGLKQRREGENLLLFRSKDADGEYSPFYAPAVSYAGGKVYLKEEALVSLYVDEGVYQDVLVADEYGKTSMFRGTVPWCEYVDFGSFTSFLVKLLAPGFEAEQSPYIGRGFTQQHYAEQYAKALAEVKDERIEFYERKFGER